MSIILLTSEVFVVLMSKSIKAETLRGPAHAGLREKQGFFQAPILALLAPSWMCDRARSEARQDFCESLLCAAAY